MIKKSNVEEIEKSINLENQINELDNDIEKLKNLIENEPADNTNLKDFDFFEGLDEMIKNTYQQKVTLNQFIFNLLLSISIFIVPYYLVFFFINSSFSDISITAEYVFILLATCALMMIFLLYQKNKKLKAIYQKAYFESATIIKGIQDHFKRRIKNIENQCNLNILVKNRRNSISHFEKATSTRVQIEYHDKAIEEHLQFASSFLDKLVDRENKYDQYEIDIDYNKPVYLNIVYSPSNFENSYQLKTGIAGKSERWLKSKNMPALKEISITHDKVYSKIK